ncbi:sirohydrochlorin chelatase [Streptosporangium sp. NPDC000396]|uniref:sirohydrochlorin chelatase n=1 Tax=Streptosporangium sp. NPDC000396 TaxID=3366185 RepID=UPI0036BD7615
MSESSILPVRGRAVRPSGRRRKPVPSQLPPEAPALVLATLGDGSGADAELAALIRVDNPQIEVRLAGLSQDGKELTSELEAAARERPEDGAAAIVVPLLTGPHPVADRVIATAVAASGASVTVAEALGPHPLLAEALHIRLAEKDLARADRMRLLNVSSPVDAVILVTVGGEKATAEAQPTAVLLASRLTLPVLVASLDSAPSVAEAAERLRGIGARRIALSPCVIGPEAATGLVEAAAAEIGADFADVLGAHSLIADLAARAYGSILAAD